MAARTALDPRQNAHRDPASRAEPREPHGDDRVAAVAAVVRAAAEPSFAPAGTTPAVLVVEDNDASRRSLALLLRCYGFDVRTAADGPSGLDEALRWRPDAVVCDIGLPGMDGWELARQLRARLGPRVLLVALTAYGSPADRDRSLAAGFDAHLTKPAEPEELRRLLRPRAGPA